MFGITTTSWIIWAIIAAVVIYVAVRLNPGRTNDGDNRYKTTRTEGTTAQFKPLTTESRNTTSDNINNHNQGKNDNGGAS